MPHRQGSFHGDLSELLERFAHMGTPAALEDQLRDAKADEDQRRQCPSYLNQKLFERSQR